MCLRKISCVFVILCIPLSIQFSNLRRIFRPNRLKNEEKTDLQTIIEEFEFDHPYIVKSEKFVDRKQLKTFFKNDQFVRICRNISEIPYSIEEKIPR